MAEHQSYYAIIPADVRYDSSIPMGAKLLYGEITCLCNKEGYCWATNAYFAKLYQVSDRSIQRWLESLRDKGYIGIKIERGADVQQTKRHITIKFHDCRGDMTKMSPPRDKNVVPPHDKNVTHNNTSINNKKERSAPSLSDDVLTAFQNKIYPMPKMEDREKLAILTEEYGTKRMILAIDTAMERGKRNINYIGGILRNWNDGDSAQMKKIEVEEEPISGAEFMRQEAERQRLRIERDERLAALARQQQEQMQKVMRC